MDFKPVLVELQEGKVQGKFCAKTHLVCKECVSVLSFIPLALFCKVNQSYTDINRVTNTALLV